MEVILEEYNPAWPEYFLEEKERLTGGLKARPALEKLEVEHIGSTSVLGLAAKPVIDIQIGVSRIEEFERANGIERIQSLGYGYLSHFNEMLPFRRLFQIKPSINKNKETVVGYNIHLVPRDHPWWGRHLLFRDYLRTSESARQRYEAVKRKLAQFEWENMPEYADAKTEVVLALEEEAFEWVGLDEPTREHIRSSRL
jgi:GrpB-like predicted nucleotidyltransferase (UPF0157 family)